MASEKAPVKATGGGGFLFAARAAALFFAQMLTGSLPLGSERGTLSKIEFENRDRGWLLDDLLLILEGNAGQSFCGISLKSNDQVTQSGFPKDFVRAVWEQTKGSAPFRPDRDLLALGTARIATGVKAAWDQLLLQAIETAPDRLVLRLKEEGQSSEIQRDLFSSLRCPPDIGPADPLATASLLRTVRLLVWDFETEPSTDESRPSHSAAKRSEALTPSTPFPCGENSRVSQKRQGPQERLLTSKPSSRKYALALN